MRVTPAWQLRPALPEDAAACVRLRGLTRENAVSEERLASLGITGDSWAADIRSGVLPGHVAMQGQQLLGYAFGDRRNGEVVVLALLPQAEGQGLGRELLRLVLADLSAAGFTRVFLGCSTDPQCRSYGFYRHLGWRSTGCLDAAGDEILERLLIAVAPSG